jgi:hypothetical protein
MEARAEELQQREQLRDSPQRAQRYPK